MLLITLICRRKFELMNEKKLEIDIDESSMSIIELRIRCNCEIFENFFCFGDVSLVKKLLSSLLSSDNNFSMKIILKV